MVEEKLMLAHRVCWFKIKGPAGKANCGCSNKTFSQRNHADLFCHDVRWERQDTNAGPDRVAWRYSPLLAYEVRRQATFHQARSSGPLAASRPRNKRGVDKELVTPGNDDGSDEESDRPLCASGDSAHDAAEVGLHGAGARTTSRHERRVLRHRLG